MAGRLDGGGAVIIDGASGPKVPPALRPGPS